MAGAQADSFGDCGGSFGFADGVLLLTSKRAAKKFGEKGGSIINIGSVASALAPPASSIAMGVRAT
jgi:hypothetical protein